MGHVDVSKVAYALPDGRPLLFDTSFRVGEGDVVALLGVNGAGKTTLLRMIAGDIEPDDGTVTTSGGVAYMRQLVGSVRDRTVRELLASTAAPRVREAAAALAAGERAVADDPTSEAAQLGYADAIAAWTDADGWDVEVGWDVCCRAALGLGFHDVAGRSAGTLSGGEQKRLVLEALLRGRDEVLLLDEPDNYLDVPGKRWLEERLRETGKTVLFISHDRELVARTARRIVTVEGRTAWTHGGGLATYPEARADRHARMAELVRRWQEEHARLKELVRRLRDAASVSPDMASRYQAMQTRLRKFEEAGPPPEPPRDQTIRMRLPGGRTGVRVVMCERLAIAGLVKPFDLEVHFGERVAVLGANGSGKSHFMRLLAGEDVPHEGTFRLGARVVPGLFAQTHDAPALRGRTPLEVLADVGLDRSRAMASLTRYGLGGQAQQRFETLSGGQQARLQILVLETGGVTLLLLDEPTDNLDLESAEALERGIDAFEGTVLAVTHDRWFARTFDRFVVFRGDARVAESSEPVWDETRADPRARGARGSGSAS